MRIKVNELNTGQLMEVDFDECDVVKKILQTCYAFPEDYPLIELDIACKKFQAWFVGEKATGNRVFILKNGTCITEEKRRIRDLSSIIWRLRLKRD